MNKVQKPRKSEWYTLLLESGIVRLQRNPFYSTGRASSLQHQLIVHSFCLSQSLVYYLAEIFTL
jgi:hypothetical protein